MFKAQRCPIQKKSPHSAFAKNSNITSDEDLLITNSFYNCIACFIHGDQAHFTSKYYHFYNSTCLPSCPYYTQADVFREFLIL